MVVRNGLEAFLLSASDLGVKNPSEYPWPSAHDRQADVAKYFAAELKRASAFLTSIGGLDAEGNITPRGRALLRLSGLPYSVAGQSALLAGRETSLLGPVALVVELLENNRLVASNGVMRIPPGPEAALARTAHERLCRNSLDDLDVLACVVHAWRSAPNRESWSAQNYVNNAVLEEAWERATATCRELVSGRKAVAVGLPRTALGPVRRVLTANFSFWTYHRSSDGTFLPTTGSDSRPALPDLNRLSDPGPTVVAIQRQRLADGRCRIRHLIVTRDTHSLNDLASANCRPRPASP
jgi:HrpA-like RNA helicase